MNFGALRVLNDDRVAPGKGFGTHPHKNMEIISIPLKGKLKHGDNHQNSRIIIPGDIQTMSAGTGIYHKEHQASASDAATAASTDAELSSYGRRGPSILI